MSFHEVDDIRWLVIEPYLPKPKPTVGLPRANELGFCNGILYVLATGCSWHDAPPASMGRNPQCTGLIAISATMRLMTRSVQLCDGMATISAI